ncbi:DUF4822 domain-containing protein [Streptomyces sp. AC495_CC817]|uniref:DUF4822 domain-containing protein n=1 Tax=Streptomyces sp. AC495_CC817 TaxID=2823900 RepID=UPI001C25C90D|nr:DUF4822 domain-containing protein [Streptomyces sp. AC495_CC817]
MSSRPSPSRRRTLVAAVALAAALCSVPAAALAAEQHPGTASVAAAVAPGSPSAVLASTAWETTGAVDQDGAPVALTDPAVSNFVGWAYYDEDGGFRIYNLDDTLKMQGDWEVAADGSTRTIVAKDASGATLFTRVVPIVTLTDAEFTYRVIPDAANPAVYYDIVHTPTDHAEPGTMSPSAVLASTAWETTGAVDQDGVPVALTDPAVSNFVGWAYYAEDGAFRIYNLDDTLKMQGDWEVAADGSTRTIVAKDASGATLFTRVVPIVTLTDQEFTYRVIPDAANPGVYYDIVHTPTDHAEPSTPAPAPVDETEEAVEAEEGELAATGGELHAGIVAAAIAAIAAGGAVLWFRLRRRARDAG